MKESKEKLVVGWQKGPHFPGEVCVDNLCYVYSKQNVMVLTAYTDDRIYCM